MKKYADVKIDYYNQEDEVWCVDAWLPDEEDGRVVAYITDKRKVLYCDPDARCCEVCQTAIKAKLEELNKEE